MGNLSTILAGSVDCTCFDKMGTITEDSMDMLYPFILECPACMGKMVRSVGWTGWS